LIHKSGREWVPFELLQEVWNEYIFSDNVTVRTRLILTTVLREYDLGPLSIYTEKVTTVSAPEELKGAPGNFEQGFELHVPRWECAILLRNEKWNEYSLEGGVSRARILFAANKAYRMQNAYDQFGQPVYYLDGSTLVRILSNEK